MLREPITISSKSLQVTTWHRHDISDLLELNYRNELCKPCKFELRGAVKLVRMNNAMVLVFVSA